MMGLSAQPSLHMFWCAVRKPRFIFLLTLWKKVVEKRLLEDAIKGRQCRLTDAGTWCCRRTSYEISAVLCPPVSLLNLFAKIAKTKML